MFCLLSLRGYVSVCSGFSSAGDALRDNPNLQYLVIHASGSLLSFLFLHDVVRRFSLGVGTCETRLRFFCPFFFFATSFVGFRSDVGTCETRR